MWGRFSYADADGGGVVGAVSRSWGDAAVASRNGFGNALRRWRAQRGLSQLAVASAAGISARHLSFLETGRASPSREMIVRLAEVLAVPTHERGVLLESAGFAPGYAADAPLAQADRGEAWRVLDATMCAFDGSPALVVDRTLRILRSNDAARAVLERCVPIESRARAGESLITLLASSEGMGSFVENADEMTAAIAAWVHRGSLLGEPAADATLRALIAHVPRVEPRAEARLVPARLRIGDLRLTLHATVTALWTPRDRTLDVWRVFAFLPVDDQSARALAQLVARRA